MKKPSNTTAKHQSYSSPPSQVMISNLPRAQESGQDDPDVLFLYGKALFQVAQKNSEVLGGAPVNEPSFGMSTALQKLIF